MKDINGSVVLVTGGARGIGSAISRELAARSATVVITDIDVTAAEEEAAHIRRAGARAFSFGMDVTERVGVAETVFRIASDVGPIDILVNNAGVSSRRGLLSIEEREWDRTMDVNVKGVFLLCKAVVPSMIERRHGRIINIGSVLSKQGEAMLSHYAASKFAVLGFSQSLAAELAPYDVTVNTVCPGVVYTSMWDGLFAQAISTGDVPDAEALKATLENVIPLGRSQSPQDIAAMVAFLASRAGRNITGGSFHVDGGYRPR